jgi:hypothetical protein
MEDNLLETTKKKRKSYYRRKAPKLPITEPEVAPITDRDGMEAIVEPEKPVELETIPPPAPPIDMHREDLKSDIITMGAVIPSVGPSLSDDFIQAETKEPGISMQNTSPSKFPWHKPKEKKTALPMITMSSLRPRKGK